MEKKKLFLKWLKIFAVVLAVLIGIAAITTGIYCAVKKQNPITTVSSFFKSDKKEIIGIWESENIKGATAFVFRDDGTYDRYFSTVNFTGTYKLDGNKIILTNPDSELELVYKYSISGDKMTMNTIDKGKDLGEKISYKKVDRLNQKTLDELIAESKELFENKETTKNSEKD